MVEFAGGTKTPNLFFGWVYRQWTHLQILLLVSCKSSDQPQFNAMQQQRPGRIEGPYPYGGRDDSWVIRLPIMIWSVLSLKKQREFQMLCPRLLFMSYVTLNTSSHFFIPVWHKFGCRKTAVSLWASSVVKKDRGTITLPVVFDYKSTEYIPLPQTA